MAANGNEIILNALIDAGCSVNVQNQLGETALHVACVERQERAAAILVENGADINIKNNEGQTPLDLCPYKRFAEILKKSYQ